MALVRLRGDQVGPGTACRAKEELKKSPYDAVTTRPAMANKAVLGYLVPSGTSQHKLNSVLSGVIPQHFGVIAATDEMQAQPPLSSATAQVNLAASVLANGQPLKALKIVSPVCRAAWGMPDGVVIKAFCVAVEAQVQLQTFQEASETLSAMEKVFSLPSGKPSLVSSTAEAHAPPPPETAAPQRSGPIPHSSLPVNASSCLPSGFSTQPTAVSTVAPVATAAEGSQQSNATAQALVAAEANQTPPSNAFGAASSTSPWQQEQGQVAPSGAHVLHRDDVALVHAWLSQLVTAAESTPEMPDKEVSAPPASEASGSKAMSPVTPPHEHPGVSSARDTSVERPVTQEAVQALALGPMRGSLSTEAVAFADQIARAGAYLSSGRPALAATTFRGMLLSSAADSSSTNANAAPSVTPRKGAAWSLAAAQPLPQVQLAAAQAQRRLASAVLQQELPPRAGAAVAAGARAALVGVAGPEHGSAAYWLRRGEAALRCASVTGAARLAERWDEAVAAFCNALMILNEEASATRPKATAVEEETSSTSVATAAAHASSAAQAQEPRSSDPPTPHAPTQPHPERIHMALTCISNLCYLHLQCNNPHACISCATRWFHRTVSFAPSDAGSRPAAVSPEIQRQVELLEGFWSILEGAMRMHRSMEVASRTMEYVAEALCMLGHPEVAVEGVQWARELLVEAEEVQGGSQNTGQWLVNFGALQAQLTAALAVAQAHCHDVPSARVSASEALQQLAAACSMDADVCQDDASSDTVAIPAIPAPEQAVPVWQRGPRIPVPENFEVASAPPWAPTAEGGPPGLSVAAVEAPAQETVAAAMKDLGSFSSAIDPRSIYVGNVDYSVGSDVLAHYFKGCGKVTRVTIPKNKDRSPRGHGYVQFADPRAVDRALDLDGTTLAGRVIKVTRKLFNGAGYSKYVKGGGADLVSRGPAAGNVALLQARVAAWHAKIYCDMTAGYQGA